MCSLKIETNFIINLITISILFSFSIYHFLLYFGRRKIISEKYNLYFSLFSLSIVLFIFFMPPNVSLASKLIPNYQKKISPTIIFFITMLLAYFFVKILIHLLDPSKIFNYFSRILFTILTLVEIATLPALKYGFNWYAKYLDIYLTLIAGIICLIYIFIFLYYIIIKKKYKDPVIFIFTIAFLLLGLYLIINSIILTMNENQQINNNYGFIAIYIVFLAYSLSLKSNKEFKELIDLKNNLKKRIEERTFELQRAKEEIEKSSKEKENFFTQVAHEIKTPLTLIDNYIDKDITTRGISESLKIAKYNSNKLKRDILNILDIEKINNYKKINTNQKIVNFTKILTNSISIFSEPANIKNIKIESRIDNDILIKIDPNDLDKIINNLIDNSIKYSNKNGLINIILKKEDDIGKFIIKDNGIGMTKEQLKNIFEPYYQINLYKNNNRGFGLGLFIVKKALDNIGGNIFVESEENKGTKFILEFKLHCRNKKDNIIESIDHLKPVFRKNNLIFKPLFYDKIKKNILIIEDNTELLYYLYNSFYDKYNVYYAENGNVALRKINVIPKPDLIISDIMMNGLDGFDFLDIIKTNRNFNDIPLIFLTAKSKFKFKMKGLKKGAIDYIEKPFKLEELMAKAESIIRIREISKKKNLKNFKNIILKTLKNKEKKDNEISSLLYKKEINQREAEVITLIIRGKEIKEISTEINLSISGVKKRINNIYKKFDIHNKVELINYINSYQKK